mgnify:CR=1 FL=1
MSANRWLSQSNLLSDEIYTNTELDWIGRLLMAEMLRRLI